MKNAVLLVLLAAGHLAGAPALAQAPHEARAIVTGMDGRMREQGLRQGLREVLVRASGDPSLAEDPRVDALDLAPLLVAYAYTDRMGHLPRQDEQGSRDRPYDLHSHWDAAGVAEVARALGSAPWPLQERPTVTTRVEVTPRVGGAFTLAPDTDVDERHRAGLLAAAARYGLVLRLDPLAREQPGATVLSGELAWVEGEGWRAQWVLDWEDRTREWSVSGVSFDEAYRAGVGGAAQQMSLYWRNR